MHALGTRGSRGAAVPVAESINAPASASGIKHALLWSPLQSMSSLGSCSNEPSVARSPLPNCRLMSAAPNGPQVDTPGCIDWPWSFEVVCARAFPNTLPGAGVTLSGGKPPSSRRSVSRWWRRPRESGVVLLAGRVKCGVQFCAKGVQAFGYEGAKITLHANHCSSCPQEGHVLVGQAPCDSHSQTAGSHLSPLTPHKWARSGLCLWLRLGL